VEQIEDQMRTTRLQFPFPGASFALDSKAMHVEKCLTGGDELDAAFEILTKSGGRGIVGCRGKSGLHGDKAAGNARRERSQG